MGIELDRLLLVTIITPAYNRGSFLEETIQSVISQDYPCIEYIVLDDGSTDNTGDILKKHNGRLSWECHPNMGETRTVNKGFSMAKGEIVCVVNSDDPLLPGAVSGCVKALEQHPDALAAYPDWLEIDSDSHPLDELRLPDYNIYNMLEDFNVGLGPGTFIRKRAFDLIGYRNLSLKYTGDLDFWFRLALRGPLIHVPQVLATHRTHGDSASVAAKGARMSGELVEMVTNLYSQPDLPNGLCKMRSSVLSQAHEVASHYCGSDVRAARRHKVRAFRLNPSRFILQWLRSGVVRIAPGLGLASVKRVVLAVSLKMASLVLPRLRAPVWLFLHFQTYLSETLSGRTERAGSPAADHKFIFVSHALPPSWSGQSVVIGRLLRDADPAGYCLVHSDDYGVQGNPDFIPTLPGKYCQVPRKPLNDLLNRPTDRRKWLSLMRAAFSRGWDIARIATSERASILVAATGNVIDLPAAYLASRLLHIPFFPYLFDDYQSQWQEPILHSFANTFASLMFLNSKAIIVPNEFLAQIMCSRYKDARVLTIHNPCESDEPDGPGTACTDSAVIYTGAIYHVNFGAFRNLITALDVLGLPDLKLHLYTAQPEDYLKAEGICGSRVEYHAHVPPREVARVQGRAAILYVPFSFDPALLPIIKTSAPGKLGDYLASGRPILVNAPSDSFVAWYMTKHRCGLVVDTEDPEELARAIGRLIRDPDLVSSLTANARRRVLLDFAPAQARKRFLEEVLAQ